MKYKIMKTIVFIKDRPKIWIIEIIINSNIGLKLTKIQAKIHMHSQILKDLALEKIFLIFN